MNPYLEIVLNDKVYIQRTPTSKIFEFSMYGEKLNTYDTLPEELQEKLQQIETAENNPELHFQYKIMEDSVIITKIDTSLTHVKIPSHIEGLPVTAIDSFAVDIDTTKRLEQIILPDTIEKICPFAFSNANALRYINLPEDLYEIPAGCFSNCTNLRGIDFSKIRIIGNEAFRRCAQLKKAVFENVSNIGQSAFKECLSLSVVSIEGNITSIGNDAFSSCISLQRVILPKSLETICANAFNNCMLLTDINFEEGLKKICEGAFRSCSGLKEFTSPESLEEIGDFAFRKSGLEKIVLTKNIKDIGGAAFSDLKELQEVIIYDETAFSMKPFNIADVSKIKVMLPDGTETRPRIPQINR